MTRLYTILAAALVLAVAACGSDDTSSDFKQNAGGASGSTGALSSGSTGSGSGAGSGACSVFPADNWWNTDISAAPVDPRSDAYIASMGLDTGIHPDFGSVYGIPFVNVDDSVAKQSVEFDYADESDPGPYPIPADPPIEDGGDRHILMVHSGECVLYELFAAEEQGGGWHAGSGAIWDLKTNSTRPAGWTSADAAGLPIYPGLARYEEAVGAGEIRHALRFTASNTQAAYAAPASHYASDDTDPNRPPMGLRVRLKADVDISGYSPEAQAVLTALKRYGMFLADNGSDWYVTGAPNPSWNDDALHDLGNVRGGDFEAVETGPLTK